MAFWLKVILYEYFSVLFAINLFERIAQKCSTFEKTQKNIIIFAWFAARISLFMSSSLSRKLLYSFLCYYLNKQRFVIRSDFRMENKAHKAKLKRYRIFCCCCLILRTNIEAIVLLYP